MPKCPQSRFAVIVVPAIHPDNAHHRGRNVQSVAWSTTLERFAEVGEIEPIHDLKQEPDQHQEEDYIDMVTINSIIFNNEWLVITANLKTSSNHISIIV